MSLVVVAILCPDSFVMFLGTTISPWIVTLDALEPFACDAPNQVSLPFQDRNLIDNYIG